MKLIEIRRNVFHLQFEDQYAVASTFLRLQEYYESPYEEIQGKFFSFEEYMDVYARNNGNFTYMSDWSGFNIPDWAVKNFFGLFWNDLWNKEKLLYKTISPLLSKSNKFYLIATYDNDDLSHEIAHGYYYLYEEYQKNMDELVREWKYSKRFSEILISRGYRQSVMSDEIQAYLSTGRRDCLVDSIGVDRRWEIPCGFSDVFMVADNKFSIN